MLTGRILRVINKVGKVVREYGPRKCPKQADEPNSIQSAMLEAMRVRDSCGKLVAGWIGKRRPWNQRGKTETGKIKVSARRVALDFQSRKSAAIQAAYFQRSLFMADGI